MVKRRGLVVSEKFGEEIGEHRARQVAGRVQRPPALRAVAAVVGQRRDHGGALEQTEPKIFQSLGQVVGLDERVGPVGHASLAVTGAV
jgi:hypothetical protein